MENTKDTSILYANDLSVAYGDKVIIPSMQVFIPKGKITSIIGPNGCGKSTLLKSLARVIPHKTGEIVLDGKGCLSFLP